MSTILEAVKSLAAQTLQKLIDGRTIPNWGRTNTGTFESVLQQKLTIKSKELDTQSRHFTENNKSWKLPDLSLEVDPLRLGLLYFYIRWDLITKTIIG